MEFGMNNNDSLDDSELLFLRYKSKKKRTNSRCSSIDQSFNRLKVSMQMKERCDIHSILIKFYSILLLQQLLCFVSCLTAIKADFIRRFVNGNPLLFLGAFISCVGMSLFSYIHKKPFRKSPWNWILFIVFTCAYIYSLVYICISIESYLMIMAIFTQFVIIVALEIYFTMAKEEMSYTAAMITVVVAGGFHYCFFNIYAYVDQVRILLSLIWLLLWGFYLIFWTRKIIQKEYKIKKNDFILAAFRFYLLILFFFSMIYSLKGYYVQFLNEL